MTVNFLKFTANIWLMARVDTADQSIWGTWIDGYLPGIEKMRELAQLYRGLDIDQRGLPREYGFSQAGDVWKQKDFFGAIASAIRANFDYENLHPDVRPTPCFMWLMQVDKEPSDAKILPLYEEYLADPRRQDYYHLISIHDECPVKEGCLQKVIKDLHFEPKLETAYANQERFTNAVREVLTRYVNIMAAPWFEVERRLDAVSDNVTTCGP